MRVLLIAVMMMVAMTTGLMALTVEGTVTDSETGEAIEGATVRFVYTEIENIRGNGNGHGSGSGGGNGYNAYTTVTDVNGHYVFDELPEGLFNVIARKTGAYPSVRFEGVEFTSDSVYDFELIPGDCELPAGSGSLFLKFSK